MEDGYNTFSKLEWVLRTSGNAFREMHGGKHLYEILKVRRDPYALYEVVSVFTGVLTTSSFASRDGPTAV